LATEKFILAQIPLRIYLQQIEHHLANDQAEQARMHCRQILKYYPEHLLVNKLLGIGCLKDGQYAQSKDAFLKVQASLPEDVIAQLGLGVILETTGEIEAAAWHMQRAYEIEPANPAIKSELERIARLRGSQEDSEALLTRYALARMYLKGGLQAQAIAELLAAIREEPQRLDLPCLLIRVYRQSAMLYQAVQIAVPLLERLPGCLEANLVLFLSGADATQPGEKSASQIRLEALDPYYAGATPQAPNPDDLPAEFVMLERLDA
jgi:hypothetical protein